MDDWDSENFEPADVKLNSDKWEGEDEEDVLKDNWDDEEEEKEKEEEKPKVEVKKGGKKYLQMKLKEKEEEKKREAERRRQEEEEKTPEEKMRDKLLAQKLAEESDMAMTKELFTKEETTETSVSFGDYNPRTKADFIEFAELIKTKLTSLEESPHYAFLVETLVNSCTVCLNHEEIKKISSSLNALASEKLKQERAKKGTKKTQKAKLGGGMKSTRNDAMEDFSSYNDFDDFM
nr:eukaryotic translation initiation factor 3 subunit J-A-like [Ciona intestinalis]|eukprot:XP_026693408.1 eukaryotic translation initiation factor 3 subunit J-A-like [Ciona intestinalis]